MFIHDQAGVDRIVALLQNSDVVTLDTEFAAERRYFPRFDLMQLGNREVAAAIDMHADIDLRPIFELMTHKDRTVVVHGGSQDMALLYRRMGRLPTRVVDTQLAAAMVGLGNMQGYAILVKKVLGVTLSKTESLTDWARRPLKPEQLEYALDDVRFLFPLYEELMSRLGSTGRLEWMEEDSARLYAMHRFMAPEPRERWRRTLGWTSLTGQQLSVLRELAAWRESHAARLDVPARVVLPDDVMTNLARRMPTHIKELREIRQIFERTVHESGQDILAAIRRGQEATDFAEFERALEHHELVGWPAMLSLLDTVVQIRAEALSIAASVLASVADLEHMIQALKNGHPETSIPLQGWRKNVIGDWLLKAYRGELSVCLDPALQKIVLRDVVVQDVVQDVVPDGVNSPNVTGS